MKAAFQKICRTYPVDEKIWITEHYMAVNAFLQELALEGQGWLNVRVLSPLTLAQRVISAYAPQRRWISYDDQCLILERIFHEAVSYQQLRYFHVLAKPQQFIRTLPYVFSSLRGVHCTPEQLNAEHFLIPAKGEDLRTLWLAYEQHLIQQQLYDKQQAFSLALELLQQQKTWDVPAQVLWVGDEGLNEQVRDFLRYFAKNKVSVLPAGVYVPEKKREAVWSFQVAYSPWCEVHSALKWLLEREIPWDGVDIVVPNGNIYGPLLRDVCEHLGIAATYEEGLALMATKPGRFWRVLRDVVLNDWREEDMLLLLSDGLFRAQGQTFTDDNRRRIAKIFSEAAVQRQRGRYEHWCENKSADEPEILEEWRNFLKDLLHLTSSNTEVSLRDVAEGFARLIEIYAVAEEDGDKMAKDDLIYALLHMTQEVHARDHVRSAVMAIDAVISRVRTAVCGRRPGAVHVRSWQSTAYVWRETVIFLGLNDTWIPGQPRQDALLLDEEKKRISPHLDLSHSAAEKHIEHLEQALQAQQHSVLFSCVKTVPMSMDYGLMPSPLMLWAYRMHCDNEKLSYEDMLGAVDRNTSYADSLLWRWDRQPEMTLKPWIAAGVQMIKQRQSPAVTIYDGQIFVEKEYLEWRDQKRRTVSATFLQTWAVCPFQYYLRYVLGLENSGPLRRAEDKWLSAQDLGSFVHDVYFLVMTAWQQQSQWTKDDVQKHFNHVVSEQLKRWRGKRPPASEVLYRKDEHGLIHSLKGWVDHEYERQKRTGSVPRYFETSFGRFRGEHKGVLSQDDPVDVVLSKGQHLQLSGSIDRIDQNADGSYSIIDYKTSVLKNPREVFAHGQKIQLFLYAVALKKILQRQGYSHAVVRDVGYDFATQRGGFKRHDFAVARYEQTAKRLVDAMLDEMAKGLYVWGENRDGETGVCESCVGAALCRSTYRSGIIKNKWDNNDNRELDGIKTIAEEKEYS